MNSNTKITISTSIRTLILVSIFVYFFVGLLLTKTPHSYAQSSCEVPTSCSPGEAVNSDCQPVTKPVPCLTGNEPIFVTPGKAGDIINNDITLDDEGLLGTKRYDNVNNEWDAACGADGDNLRNTVGPLCRDEIIIQSPDPSLPVKGFWWRMHDHEDTLFYELSICRQQLVNGDCPSWGSPVKTAEVHTSSQSCGYVCSGNDDVHPRFGGTGDQGCGGPIPDLKYCHAQDERIDWPCAVSYDEHSWNTNSCAGEPVTAIKLKFTGDNGHVHIADTLWVFDAPSCAIQGYKSPDQAPYSSNTITIKNSAGEVLETTSEQPYFFENLPADREYIVEGSGAELLGSTSCINGEGDCLGGYSDPSFEQGNSRTVYCPADKRVDLWWWYGEEPTPTPTPTPIPEPCTQNAVITLPEAPPAQAGKINLKIMFQGVDWANIAAEELKNQLVDITVSRQIADTENRSAVKTVLRKTYENIQFTAQEHENGGPIAMWTGSFTPTGMGPADDYSILVKGPMHVRRKICQNNPTDEAESGLPYNCTTPGTISLSEDENNLNFSQILLNAGDLPVSGRQDGVVNGYDISATINMLKNGLSSEASDLNISDMDLNGVVNAKDRSYLIETLEEKYGDEE